MARGGFETTVGLLGFNGVVYGGVGVIGVWLDMIGWRGSVGINWGCEWTSELDRNTDELRVADADSKSSGIFVDMMDDWREFKIHSSIDLFSLSFSIFGTNSGFRTIVSSVVSDLFSKKERSKYSSKGRSSINNHSLGQELDLKIGLGLSELSCLSTHGMRLGFSNTGEGFESRLDLVYLL